MAIMAIDQTLKTVAMKKIYDDQLVSILTEFNYDIDRLCSHLKINGDQIHITFPDKNELIVEVFNLFLSKPLLIF